MAVTAAAAEGMGAGREKEKAEHHKSMGEVEGRGATRGGCSTQLTSARSKAFCKTGCRGK